MQGLSRNSVFLDGLAFGLVLITPFVNFLGGTGYDFIVIETGAVLVFLLCLAIALAFLSSLHNVIRPIAYTAVVVLFVDVQFEFSEDEKTAALAIPMVVIGPLWIIRKHAGVTLVAVFATMNLASGILALAGAAGERRSEYKVAEAARHDLPTIVHLILDEHIGVRGIPLNIEGGRETRAIVLETYQDYGFKVFGGAYSEYFHSNDSIASILNFDVTKPPATLYEKIDSDSYVLKQNSYFRRMSNLGYRIHVYQSSYMDYCRSGGDATATCYTYNHYAVRRSSTEALNTAERLNFLVRRYINLSFSLSEGLKAYNGFRDALGVLGNYMPEWHEWNGLVSPISTMPVFDRIIYDIETGAGPRLFFAHILLPHFPYIYSRACAIRRPLFTWRTAFPPNPSVETRNDLYPLYFDQILCTLAKIRELFDRMQAAGTFDNSVIIVHGDHGSRIGRVRFPFKNKDGLATQDLLDNFSTLFAVKKPSHRAGFDPLPRPVREILHEVVHGLPEGVSRQSEHFVFQRKPDGGWTRLPFPLASE